jgi:phosphatidylserine/phosphatidylglycerophosphate/cardiolipin synthase-like enzyme
MSYRRSDSKVFTGRILDRLVATFGDRNVFRDIEDIPFGKDFREVLAEAVEGCHVMLVMIGPTWTSVTNNNGEKRLFDPGDFVRFEVGHGLKRADMPVIPVLVMNANMPSPDDLPDDLKELSYRNAIVVRDDPDFPTDMARLTGQLRRVRPMETIVRWALAAVPVAALIVVLAAFLPGWIRSTLARPANPSVNTIQFITATPGTSIEQTTDQPVPDMGTSGKVDKGFTLYNQADQNSLIVQLVRPGEQLTVIAKNDPGTWLQVQLGSGVQGWISAEDFHSSVVIARTAVPVAVGKGFGARTDAWQVYFTSPSENPNPQTEMGIDARLGAAISQAEDSLDIAAFQFDNKILTQMVLDAIENGISVRIVTDDDYGLGDPENNFNQFEIAGAEIVTDQRSGLMHDNFLIIDGKTVWTGSWSYTEKGTYQNNDNALVFEAPEVVALYQHEFNQMFEEKQFGPRSPSSPKNEVVAAGIPAAVYFSPHDDVQPVLKDLFNKAQTSIKFLAFSFTDDDYSNTLQQVINRGIPVDGIFETSGSDNSVSEFKTLFCAGAKVRTDGNRFLLHHKVVVIDEKIVITGSTNFTLNGLRENNENTIIIQDTALAKVYLEEFKRLWSETKEPTGIQCK